MALSSHPARFLVARYAAAVATTALAALVTTAAWPLCASTPMAFFFAAVMLSGWFGGPGPALLATALSTAVADYFLLEPIGSLALNQDEAGAVVVFGVVSAFIAACSAARPAAEALGAALRRSEGMNRRLFDSGRDCLKLLTVDGRVLAMNEAGCRLMEVDDFATIRGLEWASLWPQASRGRIRDAVARAAAGEVVSFDAACPTAKGAAKEWEIQLTPIAGPDGRPERIHCFSRDVTARKRAEAGLIASEARYRSLFESIDEGFCIIEMIYDADGRPADYRFLEANPAFSVHTGLHDAPGRTMREMVPDHDEHWFEIYGRVAATGEPIRFVNTATQMGGQWFDLYAFPVGGPAWPSCSRTSPRSSGPNGSASSS